MTWTATLVSVTKSTNNANLVARIQYSSDTGDTVTQDFPGNDLTNDAITAQAQAMCTVLEARDAAAAALMAPGPIALS